MYNWSLYTEEQGCGELKTGSAVALLGQGLAAQAADVVSWALGRGQGQGDPGR